MENISKTLKNSIDTPTVMEIIQKLVEKTSLYMNIVYEDINYDLLFNVKNSMVYLLETFGVKPSYC
jgi:hypothetical protein